MQMMLDCAEYYDIPEAVVRSRQAIPEDKKCWYKCVAEKVRLMDEHGNVFPERFLAYLRSRDVPEDVLAAVESCAHVRRANPCETAEAICKCMREHEDEKEGDDDDDDDDDDADNEEEEEK